MAETLTELLAGVVAARPDAVALVELDRAAGTETSMSYAQLASAVDGASALLASRGVRRGDVLAVWLPNWTEAVVVEFAAAHLGASVLGVNTRYSVQELVHLVHRARPVGLVVPSEFLGLQFAARLEQAAAEWRALPDGPSDPWVAVVRGDTIEAPSLPDIWPFRPPARGPEPTPPSAGTPVASTAEPDDPVNYFTTSGSTGGPKLAGHSQSSVCRHATKVAGAFDLRAGDVFLAYLPLSGVFGFNSVMAALSVGATCVLEPVFDTDAALGALERFGVTHLIGGDDVLGRLMDRWRVDRRPLPALRRGGVADFSGRVEEVVRWAAGEVGASFGGVYGSSELYALMSMWDPALPIEQRVRAGGRPVDVAIAVREVDPASDAVLPPGQSGELQFRGPNVLLGYLGDPAATARAFTEDGWFRSGDLGETTGDGQDFLYRCRAGDALRLRGFLVEPAEIEQCLAADPSVAVAKVVGARAASGGDVAVAFVTAADGATVDPDALVARCRERLAPFKVPAMVRVLDAFPVTAGTNGAKIRTTDLRRIAADLLSDGPAASR